MSTNRQALEDAFKNKTSVSFLVGSNFKESNVKIVELNTDDVCNRDFTYETLKGERYSSFENNIKLNNMETKVRFSDFVIMTIWWLAIILFALIW